MYQWAESSAWTELLLTTLLKLKKQYDVIAL